MNLEGCELCGNPVVEAFGRCASCNRMKRKLEKMEVDAWKKREKALLKAREGKKKQAPIAKVSGKMASQLRIYTAKKAKWIAGKRCAVFPELQAQDVHHKKGRVGYADEWAREQGITLLLDERFWLPVSREGHTKIELNPTWAKEKGYSLNRL